MSSKLNKRNHLLVSSFYNSALLMLDEAQTEHRENANFYNQVIRLYNSVCEYESANEMGIGQKRMGSLFYDPTEAWEKGMEEQWVPQVLEKTRLGRVLLHTISLKCISRGDYRDDLSALNFWCPVDSPIWLVQLLLCGVPQTPLLCSKWKTTEANLLKLDEEGADVSEMAREFREFFAAFDDHPFLDYMEGEPAYILNVFKAEKTPTSPYLVLTSVFLKKKLASLERITNTIKHFDGLVKVVGAWRKLNNVNAEDERDADMAYWPIGEDFSSIHDWIQGTKVGRYLLRLMPEFELSTPEIRESLIYGPDHVFATFLCAFPVTPEYKQAVDEAYGVASQEEYMEKLSILFDLLAKDPAMGQLHLM